MFSYNSSCSLKPLRDSPCGWQPVSLCVVANDFTEGETFTWARCWSQRMWGCTWVLSAAHLLPHRPSSGFRLRSWPGGLSRQPSWKSCCQSLSPNDLCFLSEGETVGVCVGGAGGVDAAGLSDVVFFLSPAFQPVSFCVHHSFPVFSFLTGHNIQPWSLNSDVLIT